MSWDFKLLLLVLGVEYTARQVVPDFSRMNLGANGLLSALVLTAMVLVGAEFWKVAHEDGSAVEF